MFEVGGLGGRDLPGVPRDESIAETRHRDIAQDAQVVVNNKNIPLSGRVEYYHKLPEAIKTRVQLPIMVHVIAEEREEGAVDVRDREVSLTQRDLETHPNLMGLLRGSSAMREGKVVEAGSVVDMYRLVLPVGISEEVGWAYLHLVEGGDVEALKGDVSFLVGLYALCEYYCDSVCQEQVGAFLLQRLKGESTEDYLEVLLFASTVMQNKKLVTAIIKNRDVVTCKQCQEAVIKLGWGVQERGVISTLFLSKWLDDDLKLPFEEFQAKLAPYKEMVGDSEVDIVLQGEVSGRRLQAIIDAFPNIRSFELDHGTGITVMPNGIERFKYGFFLSCSHLLPEIPLEERIELLRHMDTSQNINKRGDFIRRIGISVNDLVGSIHVNAWPLEEKQKVLHCLLNVWVRGQLKAYEDKEGGTFWSGLEMFKEYLSGYPVELNVQGVGTALSIHQLIKAFPQMKSLVLEGAHHVILELLPELETCRINRSRCVNISGLSGASLQELVLEFNERMGSIPNNFPRHLGKLKRCKIIDCNYGSLAALNGAPIEELFLKNFYPLDLPYGSGTVDLPLGLSKLKILILDACSFTSLAPLNGLGLVQFVIFGPLAAATSEIAFPAGLTKLKELAIQMCCNIKSLRPLEGAPLKKITLHRLGFKPEMPSLPPGCEVVIT